MKHSPTGCPVVIIVVPGSVGPVEPVGDTVLPTESVVPEVVHVDLV